MPLPLLIPLLAGGTGFAVGSWTSSTISSLLKIAALVAAVYYFFFKG